LVSSFGHYDRKFTMECVEVGYPKHFSLKSSQCSAVPSLSTPQTPRFSPSRNLHKKMRSAITFLTFVTCFYTLFFILLVTSGFQSLTTMTPSVVNLYGSVAIIYLLSGVIFGFR